MSSLIISRATIADLSQLAQLFDAYRQFYEQAPDIEVASGFIADRINKQESVIFIAKNTQFLLGDSSKNGVLYDLFVDSTARQTGAGRALMLTAYEYTANNGMARLDLSTAKNNLKAQALYESLGWERDAVFYTYSKNIT